MRFLRRALAHLRAWLLLRRLRAAVRARLRAARERRVRERAPKVARAIVAGRGRDPADWWPELAPLTPRERERVRRTRAALVEEDE